MAGEKTKSADEWGRTELKRTVGSRVIELACRVFNKSLNVIHKTLTPKMVADDWGKLILKPETISIYRPKTAKFVRIDVGLSNDASHSVECLLDNEDRLIIGIEPHPENIKGLIFGTTKANSISLKDRLVRRGLNCKWTPDLREKFLVINGAAGSSSVPIKRRFYSAYPDKGNSSFYKIHSLELTGNITDREFDVVEFPLSSLLKQITEAGFEFVETLKIDTEGHELEVLKGCGEHIRQILYCRVECFKGIYENSRHAERESLPAHIILGPDGYTDSATSIIKYLEDYNFKLVSSRPGDYLFLNRELESLLTQYEIYP